MKLPDTDCSFCLKTRAYMTKWAKIAYERAFGVKHQDEQTSDEKKEK